MADSGSARVTLRGYVRLTASLCARTTSAAANLITRQLIACTKQLRRFAVLDFSKRVSESGLRSPIKEIARIYEALHSVCLPGLVFVSACVFQPTHTETNPSCWCDPLVRDVHTLMAGLLPFGAF